MAESTSSSAFQAALDKKHTSLDLVSLCNTVSREQKVERAKAKALIREQERAKVREAARLKQEKKKKTAKEEKDGHVMTRRSQLKEIIDKPRPTYDERQLLVDHLGASKCFHCNELKPVGCFYLNRNRRLGMGATCAECIYAKFNTKPRTNFLRLMYTHCKSRSKKKGFDFDLEPQDLHDLFDRQQGLCALSSQPMTFIYKRGERAFIRHPTNASLDRINPKGGYTKTNIQLTTNLCNHSKMDLTEELFVDMCRQVTETADRKKNESKEKTEEDGGEKK